MPELHGNFHIEPVHAKDGYSTVLASDMPMERSASDMGRVVERWSQRAELMAKKRQLQGELERQRQSVQKIEASLDAVEAQLAVLNRPSPDSSYKDGLADLGAA